MVRIGMVLIVTGPTPQGGTPLCVGGCGGRFVLAGTAKQVRAPLWATRLISACKTRLTYALMQIPWRGLRHERLGESLPFRHFRRDR